MLRQRNTLLKSARGARVAENQLSTLDLWDERLVALGSEIIDGRQDLVDRLRPHVAEAYASIAGAEHRADLAAPAQHPGARSPMTTRRDRWMPERADAPDAGRASATQFRAALARVRRDELDRGLTLVGPHRDDLLLVLNGLPARGYASHGESWSFALALKLASAAVLRADSAVGDPIVILDDVFAELDEARRAQAGRRRSATTSRC